MILNVLVERLQRRSKDDLHGHGSLGIPADFAASDVGGGP